MKLINGCKQMLKHADRLNDPECKSFLDYKESLNYICDVVSGNIVERFKKSGVKTWNSITTNARFHK